MAGKAKMLKTPPKNANWEVLRNNDSKQIKILNTDVKPEDLINTDQFKKLKLNIKGK